MKSFCLWLFLLYALTIYAFPLKAQGWGEVVFIAAPGESIQVSLNGELLNPRFERQVTAQQVFPGRHQVFIKILSGRNTFQQAANIMVEPGFFYQYNVLRNRKGAYILSLFSSERISYIPPAPPAFSGQMNAFNDCFGPMPSYDFEQANRIMARTRFANTQKQLFRQIVDQNCLLTEQIGVLLNHFSFENDKLEMAKYAWHSALDPERYYLITDQFRFENSKSNLLGYIQSQLSTGPNTTPFRGAPQNQRPVLSPNASNGRPQIRPSPSHSQDRTSPNSSNFSGNTTGYRGEIGCPAPLSESEFNEVIQLIQRQSFSQTQQNVARQVAETRCLTTYQIKMILGLFSFDKDRLEFAHFAYRYCYDPGNYFLLADAFQFESSFEDLSNRIKR
jgi:hypothetical protein